MIGNDWDIVLKQEYEKEYFKKLAEFVRREYKEKEVYPKSKDVFNALKSTSYKAAKVVILGQDPYHGEGEAHGLCFSVQKGVKVPPSLKNIYKEIKEDLDIDAPDHGCLEEWTKEGVLLINSVLTVVKDTPASHKSKGWETFTNEIIIKLNEKETPIVFILWGNFAKSKKELITNKKHLVLESTHPSPFSARNGFFGSKVFSKTNEFLKKNKIKEVNWEIK